MSYQKEDYIPINVAELEKLANVYFRNSTSYNLSDKHPHADLIPNATALTGSADHSVNQGTSIDLGDPITSLPDPNAGGYGHVPHSSAGSGGATGQHDFLPFANENTFEQDLQSALKDLQERYIATPFSVQPSGVLNQYSYYFTNENLLKNPVFGSAAGFDVNLVRNDFPILNKQADGKPIIWLDNAATTQKPKQVIERLSRFYEYENSNIHRAAHALAARATDAYEEARQKVQHFINARSINEIIFVRGTTEAINLVAQSWGDQHLQERDEIIVTHLEHHANIVPWQLLAKKKGIRIKVAPVDERGQVIIDEYAKLFTNNTKLVSFTLVSNALGTITPAKQMVEIARAHSVKVLADGAQSVSHIKTDVQALDVDWFVFSGHKIYGPTGIGVLYGKEELLNNTQPYQGGGNMIEDVTFENTQFHAAPNRFEAGTGNIADAVGLGAAIDYVNKIGIDHIFAYEHYLLQYATQKLAGIPGLRFIGTAKDKTSVLSFVLDGYTTLEVGQALSKEGIAVRAGHHCAQPILRRFGLEATVRPSIAFYNTCAEIDALVYIVERLARARVFPSINRT